MHELSDAPVVATRSGGTGNRERGRASIARLGRGYSVCNPRSPSRVCASWHNGLVACPRGSISLRSVFSHWDRVRRRNKYGVVVSGAMVDRGHCTRGLAHARGTAFVSTMLPNSSLSGRAEARRSTQR